MKKGVVLCCSFVFAGLVTSSLSAQVDRERIFEQASQAVVAVIAYGQNQQEIGRGSGFAVADDLVAVPYNLISRASSAEVMNVKGRRYKVDGIISIYKEMNTALIRVRGKLQPLKIEASGPVRPDTPLILVGADDAGRIVPFDGMARKEHVLSGSREFLEIELARIPETFNGAAALDQNGRVVAMILIMEKRIFMGIKAENILGMSRSGNPLELESIFPEDYFGTLEGHLLLGQAALAQNELMTARIQLENAVRLDDSMLDIHILLAGIYRDQKDFASALTALQKIADVDPKRAEAYKGMGTVYMRMTNTDEAVKALEKAASLAPLNAEIQYELALAFEKKKDMRRAAAALEAFLKLEPENAYSGARKLGEIWAGLGDQVRAGDAWVRAGNLAPEDPAVLLQAVEAYKKGGRLDKAEEAYEILARNNPDNARDYYARILKMYDEGGEREKAVAAARKIIDLNPKNELSVYNLGVIHQKQGRFDEALSAFQQSLEINPKYAAAWFSIGTCHAQLKRWPEAIEAFSKYTELAPDDPQGCNAVGYGYLQMKRYEEALEPLRKCVDLEPNNPTFQFNLAIVYIQLGDQTRARDVLGILQGLDAGLADKLRALLR